MSVQSYIFGGDTGETPESIKRKRAAAEALMRGASRTPQNVGEGLSAIGQALLYRSAMGKVEAGEKTQSEKQKGIWDALTGAGGGTPSAGFPSAPAVPGGSQASNSTAPTEVTSGIRETAAALGIDPVDLGTAISYETAGTFDPTKAGPTTQWGQHKGLIQFGEPQAEKYGVDWSNPVGSQLGSDGAVAKYLRDTGVKPGMGLLDIYSAINAGGVGRYGASDADNGGAPGNVRDKVEQQMAGHRAKAVALLGALEPGGAASAIDRQMAPTQVASADPNFMPEEPTRMPPIAAALNGAPVQPMPPAQTVGANPVPPNAMPMAAGSSKVANALAGMSPEVQQAAAADPSFDGFSQNTGFGPAPATGGGMPDRQALMGVLSNPWASDEQRQFATMMLQQEMKRNAPMSQADQLGLQKTQLEIDQMRNPRDKPTDDMREFEFARSQGYGGDFVQFQLDQKKAGATSITNTMGGDSGDFYKEADKRRGTAMADIATSGDAAQRSLIQIGELEARLSQVGTGAAAGLKQIAGNFGIPIEGMDDIQAATALINQLVPGQRPPGSGTMSDADVQLFKQSLPRIINSEGGNQKILSAMKGIAQYDLQRGQIANAVLNREITPAEGQQRMNALPNPLAELRKGAPAAAVPGGGAAPAMDFKQKYGLE